MRLQTVFPPSLYDEERLIRIDQYDGDKLIVTHMHSTRNGSSLPTSSSYSGEVTRIVYTDLTQPPIRTIPTTLTAPIVEPKTIDYTHYTGTDDAWFEPVELRPAHERIFASCFVCCTMFQFVTYINSGGDLTITAPIKCPVCGRENEPS